jgi:uncharacterized membrane protein
LAILPLPFLAYWFFFFYNQEELLRSNGAAFQGVDSSAAVVFLILAAATVLFFRIGRRVVRVALPLVTAPSALVLAWLSYQGGTGYMALFAVAAVSLAVLLGPALLEQKAEPVDDTALALDETG